MNTRTLFAALSTALLAGCWPYLSDPYESYLDGGTDPDGGSGIDEDAVALTGELYATELRGNYWSEGADDGEWIGGSAVFYLSDSSPRSILERYSGGEGRCQPTSDVDQGSTTSLSVDSPDDLRLEGDRAYTLSWLDDDALWAANVQDGVSIALRDRFTLPPMDAGEFGTLSSDDLFTTPRRLTITDPDVSGEELSLVSRSGFDVRWSGATSGVLVRILTLDADQETLQDIICGAGPDATSLTLAPDRVGTMNRAVLAILAVGSVAQGSGDVGDGVVNRSGAIHWQQGAVAFQ